MAAAPSTSPARPVLAWRQLSLFLFAVLLPSAVVIAVGVRLVLQDRELETKRRDDAQRASVAGIRQQLLGRLEQARLKELSAIASGGRVTPFERDSSVALTARVAQGVIVLPWEDDSLANAFALARDEPAFAAAIATAERDTANRHPGYVAARALAPNASAAAYVDLLDANATRGPARQAKLESLARLPLSQRDEFGVPFALYAAVALRGDARSLAARADGFTKATSGLLLSPTLSPPACYMLRDLASGDTARIASRCRELDAAEQLARDGVPVATMPVDATPVWSYWSRASWFVTVSDVGRTRYLVAVRSPMRILTTPEEGEPLGPRFPGAYVFLPRTDLQRGTNTGFYLLALSVVLALAATSGRLLWRDVQREIATARIRAQFVSGVTHEMKTPLAAIRMYAETLRERAALPERTRAEYLDTIVGESERLTRLLDNVLTFSQIERGKRSYNMRRVAMNQIVARVARTMMRPLERQGFTLSLAIHPGPLEVLGDEDALEQALLNLVTNAVKYSGESRDVALHLAPRDGQAEIDVIDHGIGIADADREKIFEQFYRVRRDEYSAVTGAGLGLTIVRDAVEAHGGRIAVTSMPDGGSTFTMSIPLFGDAAPGAATPAASSPIAQAAT